MSNARASNNRAFLQMVKANNITVVTTLLKSNKKIENTTEKTGESIVDCIYWAVVNGNPEMLELLAKAGFKPHPTTNKSHLHEAVLKRNVQIIQLLMIFYKDQDHVLNRLNTDNETALELAVNCHYLELVDALNLTFSMSDTDLKNAIVNFKSPIPFATLKYFEMNTGENKIKLLNQIMNLSDPVLKQKALWQALDSSTFLGKLFHIPRGIVAPSIYSGTLNILYDNLNKLFLEKGFKDHLDPEVKQSLQNSYLKGIMRSYEFFLQSLPKQPDDNQADQSALVVRVNTNILPSAPLTEVEEKRVIDRTVQTIELLGTPTSSVQYQPITPAAFFTNNNSPISQMVIAPVFNLDGEQRVGAEEVPEDKNEDENPGAEGEPELIKIIEGAPNVLVPNQPVNAFASTPVGLVSNNSMFPKAPAIISTPSEQVQNKVLALA